MSSFKDALNQDIKNVFLNTEEFSDIHIFVIDGETLEIPAQIDANELIERNKDKYSDGIYRNQQLVYVSVEDFGSKPKQDAELKLDGKKYIVNEVAEENGVYSITLEAKRG